MMNYLPKLKGRTKMQVIKRKDKNIIILQNNDNLEIKTLQRNPLRLQVTVKDGTLIVNEVSLNTIEQVKLEQEQLQILKNKQN